jgi:multiple sugar transport system substrate-binding protein
MAILISGPWGALYAQGFEDLHYGIAPHPYFEDGKQATPTGSWSIGVNPHSEHTQEAIEFARFISLDSNGSLLFNLSEGSPPALLEAYSDYWDQDVYKSQPTLPMMKDILEYDLNHTAIPRPRTVGYLQFETVMGRAFSDIRNGSDPAEVLARAATELDEAFAPLK